MAALCPGLGSLAGRRLLLLPGSASLLLTLLFTTGCATRHDQLVAFLRSHEAEVATGDYVVRPPDTIRVHAPMADEVDGATQTVRADGKVVLRLLGEIDVVGLTTHEIAKKVKAQLSRYYVDPEVEVEVARYASQFYYVFGEVHQPGPRQFTGRDTLVQALAEAMPTDLAWRSQIRVVRPAADEEERKVIVIDLDKMVYEGDLTMNVLLQEGDIIQVPPTPLAWLGHRVRELLYPVDPVMDAYNTPARLIESTNTYEDHFGEADDGRKRWRGRFDR